MAPTLLTDDADFRAVCFVVIDFEATTPTGYRPEPIDVAAMALRPRGAELIEVGRFTALIRPPGHASLARSDTDQTGITAEMLAGQPDAATVLARLDARLTRPPYLLVAHNAPTEAGILYDYRAHCPRLAAMDFVDTVRLARAIFPALPSHRLDLLIHHLGLSWPAGRHRAMPDVVVTADVFRRVVADGVRTGKWRSLRELRAVGGYQSRGGRPEQAALF
ncbi:DNA polymerase-3 subunit epsilon/exodeoxyribonuclease X [Micromonospora sp. Llam0]|uniref:3'-5' exonuclease n=1 Tax=Micromonospora sp. Llam0 TaxID=2485143 RepID=UPI000F4A39EC|nr:3'-5' exonuclease [Micromonospora sp. Llam0]ROO51622.1 DNA polymerase-3 subunit epsilon/exodeoxyribonuclease X [Micromonospora sp. Llam0]